MFNLIVCQVVFCNNNFNIRMHLATVFCWGKPDHPFHRGRSLPAIISGSERASDLVFFLLLLVIPLAYSVFCRKTLKFQLFSLYTSRKKVAAVFQNFWPVSHNFFAAFLTAIGFDRNQIKLSNCVAHRRGALFFGLPVVCCWWGKISTRNRKRKIEFQGLQNAGDERGSTNSGW